ncbi:hypothetical protein RB195_007637 [Necator americanus]|uniref:Uncharacterized protein n=1 Tax=Necator americanus TaxID=51031 RepID=A0ABR1BY67_NECAM
MPFGLLITVGVPRYPSTVGRVAQWITRLPTEQKIAGSNPAVVENFSLLAFSSANLRWCAMMSIHSRPRGAMDNASAYGAEDCRFESCRGRELFAPRLFVCQSPLVCHDVHPQ